MGLEFLSIFILKEKYKNMNYKNIYKNIYKKKKPKNINSPKKLPNNESYDNLIKYHSLIL